MARSKPKAGTLVPTSGNTAGQVLPARAAKIDMTKAVQLRSRGMSYADIAKVFGVAKQSVQQRFKAIQHVPIDQLEIYQSAKAEIIEAKAMEIISSLTEDDIKKASLRDRAVAFGVFYDKHRLQTNQSTSNVSVFSKLIESACQP